MQYNALSASSVAGQQGFIDFQTSPDRYRHWKLNCQGEIAELVMDVDENGGLSPYMVESVRQMLFEPSPTAIIVPNPDGWTINSWEWGSEQRNAGRTIVEKFEAHGGSAGFAVVLATPDDVGGSDREGLRSIGIRKRQPGPLSSNAGAHDHAHGLILERFGICVGLPGKGERRLRGSCPGRDPVILSQPERTKSQQQTNRKSHF